jgi:hypothetical protein
MPDCFYEARILRRDQISAGPFYLGFHAKLLPAINSLRLLTDKDQ